MSRRTIFLIIYGTVMLVMTVLVFLDTEGTLLAKFFLVIFSGFLVFLFLGSTWLVYERDEARRHQQTDARYSQKG
jgi:hypothetical protein